MSYPDIKSVPADKASPIHARVVQVTPPHVGVHRMHEGPNAACQALNTGGSHNKRLRVYVQVKDRVVDLL